MLKPTADLNVSVELWETKGRWKMETNLTDDLKVSLGTDDAVTFTDGAGIRQVSLPRTDSKGHLPFWLVYVNKYISFFKIHIMRAIVNCGIRYYFVKCLLVFLGIIMYSRR